ncbi:MAG TPA: ABC transporter permease [Candidatus Limnocylindria bacterium]|nr:ABC transporter permease [Candidatus Limnocylindria bacterium]
MTAAAPAAAEPRRRSPVRRLINLAIVPLVAVVGALIVGGVIIFLSGFASGELDPTLPFQAYASLFKGAFGSLRGILFSVLSATPLILGGMAVGLGFKAGLFNIGAQGQFLMGALGAAGVGAWVAGAPGIVAISAAVLAGAVLGAVWGFIPGALKAWTGAHEVVTTIMLNFIAGALIGYLITGPLEAPGFSFSRTGPLGNAEFPTLFGTSIHLGVFIAFALVPVIWWLLWKSTLGFEIRTVGANPDAARYAGMHPALITILTMSLCGLLAGLAGAGQILGISHFMNASYGTSVGFDSISVALLGRAHPVGITLAALLFGAMRAGSGLMQIEAGIPVEIIDVIQATILLFLAADVVVRQALRIRAPSAEPDELQTVTKTYGSGTPV